MSNKKPLPGFVWLLAGLGIGLFVSFLMFLDQQPAESISFKDAVVQELEKVKQDADVAVSKAEEKKANNSGKEPRFDFYTILPELEVFIPESEIKTDTKTNTAPKQPVQAISGGKQYLLQAGSFRNKDDAERLKANLALLGVESAIQSVSIKNDTWHRVRIGPFSNTSRLHDTLETLKNNKIHAMTMELKN